MIICFSIIIEISDLWLTETEQSFDQLFNSVMNHDNNFQW
jgi:hypothetical protein